MTEYVLVFAVLLRIWLHEAAETSVLLPDTAEVMRIRLESSFPSLFHLRVDECEPPDPLPPQPVDSQSDGQAGEDGGWGEHRRERAFTPALIGSEGDEVGRLYLPGSEWSPA